ncbi:hypothetical protein [uncultured Sphingomonas sp.]|uniref:hypothetical protein n=1 Tax=uncultured Sphingomonas sp. TaxID=158754 RepID=UPI0025DB627C|nr:hypothetical protein [uncultured Sphingomonas sp.]
MTHRCRLCTTNDRHGLIERTAEDMWETRRHGTLDDWRWEKAGKWQQVYRELATAAVDSMERAQ